MPAVFLSMSVTKPIQLVIVEDRPVLQQRLADLFDGSVDFSLCALCSNAQDALQCLGETPCDILLVDLELPGMSGEELIPHVRERYPAIKIVVFTVFEDQARIVRLMKMGIHGYLLKDTGNELLLAELKVIMLGGSTLSPRVARRILDDDINQVTPDCAMLSERETEILNLTALGLTYRDIAEDLEISPNTVRTHIAHIYEKLQVSSKVEALNRARQLGILDGG